MEILGGQQFSNSHPSGFRTERQAADLRANPQLFFAARLIASAFLDACQVKAGKPTQLARQSLRYIRRRTDWTSIPLATRLEAWGSPAPAAQLREDFYGSFDWACAWLGLAADDVRARGLPAPVACDRRGDRRLHSKAKRTGSAHAEKHIGGIPAILACWREAARKWQEKIAQCREKYGEGECLVCGARFVRLAPEAFFCGAGCRREHLRRQRVREKRAAKLRQDALGRAAGRSEASQPTPRFWHPVGRYESYTQYANLIGVQPLSEGAWSMLAR